MKLRLQGNSVRLRLARSEVERLRETGLVEESVDFGGGDLLAYRLQSRLEQGPVETAFGQGIITVSVSKEAAQAWAGSDEVGLYAQSGVFTIPRITPSSSPVLPRLRGHSLLRAAQSFDQPNAP